MLDNYFIIAQTLDIIFISKEEAGTNKKKNEKFESIFKSSLCVARDEMLVNLTIF